MRLVLLTPSRGDISTSQRTMLLRLSALLMKEGHHLQLPEDNFAQGMIAHSRAVLLAKLATHEPNTLGLWLDADTHLEDPRRVLWAMRRPEDVIAWNYPVRIPWDVGYPPEVRVEDSEVVVRQPFRLWTGSPRMADCQVARSTDGKLVELEQCGFGAVLMTARVARDMHQSCGPHQFDGSSSTIVSSAFESLSGEFKCSEDVSFWRRLTRRGHRIWCDPVPYVTNGQSGGRFAEEIRLRESTIAGLFAATMLDY